MGAFVGDQEVLTYQSVELVSCVLASLSSIAVLYLIHKLQYKNGHMLLISTMSWFQLLYDLSLFPGTVNFGNSEWFCFAHCCNFFGGMGSSLTSNVVAFVSFYVVTFGQVIDVRKNYIAVLAYAALPGMIDVLLYSMSCSASRYGHLGVVSTEQYYYYLRIGCIGINFIICGLTVAQIYFKRFNEKRLSPAEMALRKVALRLSYYPIVQALCRSAVAWYEGVYGFDFDPTHESKTQFISQILFATITPAASYGYLAIFLIMQPKAWECLKCTLMCKPYIVKGAATCTPSGSIGQGSQLDRESMMPSTTVFEVDNRNTYGTGGSSLTEENLDEMDEEELWNLISSGLKAANGNEVKSPLGN